MKASSLRSLFVFALLLAAVPVSSHAVPPEPTPLPTDKNSGDLVTVAAFDQQAIGVGVSASGRIFLSFPRTGTDHVAKSVVELIDGRGVAFPDHTINTLDVTQPSTRFISVQAVVVDARDTLWALDTGILGPSTTPIVGGPKLVAIDLNTNTVTRTIVFPESLIGTNTSLNDVRFDLTRGTLGFAYITDASAVSGSGIIVVDLATGQAVRRLQNDPSVLPDAGFRAVVEGKQFVSQPTAVAAPGPVTTAADGIALSADGKTLYYCPIASRRLYSVSTDALADFTLSDQAVAGTVQSIGEKGLAAGLEADTQGRIYLTNPEYNAIRRFDPTAGGSAAFNGSFETLVHNRHLVWPDTITLAPDGTLYVTSSQLDRSATYNAGVDLRTKPFFLYKIQTDGTPVRR